MENNSEHLDSSKPLHVIWVGAFGRAVAEYLSLLHPFVHKTTCREPDRLRFEVWPASSVTVIAAWRPVPRLCELIAVLSQERELPFIPLLLDSGVLRLG